MKELEDEEDKEPGVPAKVIDLKNRISYCKIRDSVEKATEHITDFIAQEHIDLIDYQ